LFDLFVVSIIILIFADANYNTDNMTAVQLNAMNTELWQGIGAIADNEPLMKRLTRYVKKLVKEKEYPTLMTKEEFFAKIERAEKQPGKSFASVEELDKYIRSL
jgi:hypothetical protein